MVRSIAASRLQQLAKSGAYEPTELSRTQLQDKLLEAKVHTILDEHADVSPIGTSLGVIVTDGNVIVDGAVGGGSSIRGAISEIEKIEGVTSVTNNTVPVPLGYGP
jgi:osmotically-inducible protein OsmY